MQVLLPSINSFIEFENWFSVTLSKCTINYFEYLFVPLTFGGRRDRMVVGFTITYAISANNHYRCEFESHSGEVHSIQHYVIKFVSELRQIGGFLRFPPSIKLTATT